MSNLKRGLTVIAVGAVIWFCPVPAGLKPEAWRLFAIFVATIAGFIMQPLPIGSIAFISITFTVLTGVLKSTEVLSGFSSSTIWLIVSAFLFSRGFIKTGLGRRISYMLIKKFGDRTLKLGYILAFSEFILAPATPSNTARGGGIIYPIARSLSSAFSSEPGGVSSQRMGKYLMQIGYQANCITSAMFMTAMSANPMIALLAAKTLDISISWGLWITASIVPGILSLLIVPYFLYKACQPEVTHTPEAKILADKELLSMGVMSLGEKIVGCVFVGALLLWSTSQFTKLDATVVAMLAVSVMLMTKVLEWKDVLEERGAWDTFIWMGSLVGMADYLSKLGFIPWVAKVVSASMVGIPWIPAFLLVVVIYMYTHYGFASMVAHVVAMYSAFIAVAVATGVPPYLAALSLAYVSSLCGSLTHYAAGPAPIYFGAGYVDQKVWWKQGFTISIINLVIWIGVGSCWWKILGLW
ncbi:MAG: anion transporter [Firmicutes bacterium]|nr:anion transporter [Bacillota bacterium]